MSLSFGWDDANEPAGSDSNVMRFAEELLLLLFDDERGDLTGTMPPGRLDILLAGAVLMDLALEERIDTDLRRLMLVDPTPLDDDLLDPALADIAQASDSQDIDHWVRRQAERGGALRERALARLAERGILVESDDGAAGFLLARRVSRARRYHSAPDGTVQEEVRLRVMRVLFSDDIPDPRDTVIICLADAGGVLDYLLSREERAEVQHRIDLVTKLDLIGQAVTRAVREAESAAPATGAARPPHEIPCAAGLPLAGNALDLARDAEAFLLRQYRSLGPIFRVRAFGRRFVVLAGPDANLLLARGNVHFRTFEVWQRFDADVGAMRQIMSMGGGDHARLRKNQAPAYSTGLLKRSMAEAVDLVRSEVASWPENGPVAGQYMFQRLLLEQLGRLTTGRSPRPYLDDLIVYLEALLRTNLHGNRPRLILRLPRVRRARRRVLELAGRILADHDPARRTGLPPDYIDDVLALHRADPEFLPETDLPITVLGPFLVGLDTVSSISACMLYELLRLATARRHAPRRSRNDARLPAGAGGAARGREFLRVRGVRRPRGRAGVGRHRAAAPYGRALPRPGTLRHRSIHARARRAPPAGRLHAVQCGGAQLPGPRAGRSAGDAEHRGHRASDGAGSGPAGLYAEADADTLDAA